MKLLLICLLGLICPAGVMACDVCGAGSGSDGWGINPGIQRHFIGLRSNWRYFDGIHPEVQNELSSLTIRDYFSTHDIVGRFNWKHGLQFSLILPYKYNFRYEGENYSEQKGFGDASFHLHWMAIKPQDKNWKHALLLSAGIKAPSGKFKFSHDTPSALQPGTGSWDIPLNANYTLRNSTIGINLESSFRINGRADEKFVWGNSSSSIARFLYLNIKDQQGYMVSTGISYDWSEPNLENELFQIESAYSGGETLNLLFGIDYYTRKANISLEFGFPVQQSFADGYTKLKSQAAIRLLYYINKKQ